MNVHELLSILPEFQNLAKNPDSPGEVSAVVIDSRQVDSKSVFVALQGSKVDSHQFLSQVCGQNPLAVVLESKAQLPASYQGIVVEVTSSRQALDLLASRFNEDPSQKLLMFGVTGTNGKTSCTYMFEHILNLCGFPTGVIGTINHHLRETVWEAATTTPGPLELQHRLNEIRTLGARVVAMEVSSHALDQKRADSVQFNSVLFTNLSRDHLDYHNSMENYFHAKQRLFTDLLWQSSKVPQFAIVNIDDQYGRRLRIAGHANLWTYGKTKKADFQFRILDADFSSTQFVLKTPVGEFKAVLPVCGEHNVYNAVGVVASAAGLGIPVPYSLKALSSFAGVPGRLQPVPNNRGVHVLIDYAHTPDAMENVLKSLAELRKQNQIITVFGCGGDRDKGKRPQMAKIVDQYSNKIVVTSDNPRNEDPLAIIHDIMEGFSDKKPFIEADRRKAIHSALSMARLGDVVLIAGKGHENYQQIGNDKIPFSDMDVAKEVL